jgi:hypothetical protein
MATCKNVGLHSGEPSIADKDEAAGSSPARPTTPGLTCGNARPWLLSIAAASARRLCTAVLERIPCDLTSEDARRVLTMNLVVSAGLTRNLTWPGRSSGELSAHPAGPRVVHVTGRVGVT